MSGCPDHQRTGVAGCGGCRDTWASYERRRRARIAEGTWLFKADPAVVARHVESLRAAGMSLNQIARESGVHARTLQRLGRHASMTGAVAQAILAVRPVAAPVCAGQVPAVGAMRRVQALAALGWSCAAQGRASGIHPATVWDIAAGNRQRITEDTFDKVCALFERWSATPGASRTTVAAARRRGWLPPLAWGDIDDPAEVPDLGESDADIVDEVAVELALSGEMVPLTDAELVAAVHVGVARGVSRERLAELLHVDHRAVRAIAGGEVPPRLSSLVRRRLALVRSAA
jgi:plasmid maintenance system antidote protein VapI